MQVLRALFLILLLMLQCQQATACSFYTTVYFTYSTHPDIPLAPYSKGRLGIVLRSYARSYLVVAYRYLQEKPLSAAEQQAALALWNDRMNPTYSDCENASAEWVKARATVAGLDKPAEITIDRPIAEGSYTTYCNCLPAGFRQAAVTLKERATKYGAASEQLKQWVKAQDQVFSNCGFAAFGDKKPPAPTFPAALPAGADRLAQQDRAYQIAAAHFYAGQFDTAYKEFSAIVQDSQSPWQMISRYLAARALVRKGMLSKEEGYDAAPLEQAAKELSAMLADPSMQKLQDDIKCLLHYCQVRVAPGVLISSLSAALQKELTSDDLKEYTSTIDIVINNTDTGGLTGDYDAQPAAIKQDEMTDWICTMQSTGPQSTSHAVSLWKEKQSLPWLIAALNKIDAKSSDSPAVVSAAEKITSASKAYWTILLRLNDLQTAQGKSDEVRTRLNSLLDAPQPDLPPGSRNLFRAQRLQLARNLNEFMRDAFQKPVCLCGSGFIDQVPEDVQKLEQSGKYPEIAVHIPLDTEKIIDGQFPLSVWLQVAQSPNLVAPIKKHFLWSGFTRSVLLKNETAAKKFAEMIKPLDAKNAPLLTAYVAAPDAKTREFIGAFILLKNNREAVPRIGYGDYDEGEIWWWADHPANLPEDQSFNDLDRPQPVAAFLTASEKEQAALEFKALNAVPTAPNYLSSLAIAWAKSHPADPRVPEALHLAVRCTHYGATTDTTSKLSKEAFQILHTRYRGSPWTTKTPYYY